MPPVAAVAFSKEHDKLCKPLVVTALTFEGKSSRITTWSD